MRIIVSLLLCLLTLTVGAQSFKVEIPYRLVGGKMLVDMKLNGQVHTFIFDTGAGRTALTGELCENLGLEVVDSLVVTDVNSRKESYPIVNMAMLMPVNGKVVFRGVPAMKLPEPSPFACFGADGLIGSDLLANMIVEIDGKSNIITLSSAERASSVSLRRMLPFVQGRMPIIALQAGVGNELVCLFDTGYGGFVELKKTDFMRLQSAVAFNVEAEGYGEGSIGLSGMAGIDTSYRVCFPVVAVGSVKFMNVSAETSNPPYTLLGIKLLDYGKVTIDYPRARFYFEPYKQENDLAAKHYDLALRVKDGELIVSSVWGKMRELVSIGDRVLKINGKSVKKYSFCESIITGIPELKAKKKTKLTISTKEGEKTIVYQKH